MLLLYIEPAHLGGFKRDYKRELKGGPKEDPKQGTKGDPKATQK